MSGSLDGAGSAARAETEPDPEVSENPEEYERAERLEPAEGPVTPAEPRPGRGYLDLPDRALRLKYPEEYMEPMDRLTHQIETFRDPRSTVRRVNPDFESGRGYQVNCADAARCFERTWRGHLEEAAGRAYQIETADGRPDRVRTVGPAGLFVDGEDSERTAEWAGSGLEPVAPDGLRATLEEAGPGASAIVHSWAEGEGGERIGHAYNVVNFDGRVEVVDAQTREVLPFDRGCIRAGLGRPIEHRAIVWNPEGERIHA
ncbi:MAG: toxin glutamine deamidase domain-containing protein [Acidipropionibacterium sp.]|jgi:hypothetical protein|nr:toxin glutamine deamidase domain-containing protein [Acidipropionibacterium sp.]